MCVPRACEISLALGADHAINASEDDPVEAIHDLTGGEGADVVFECAGGSVKLGLAGDRALKQAMHAVRSGGKLVGISWFGDTPRIGCGPDAGAQPALPLPGHQLAGPSRIHSAASSLGTQSV